MKKPQDSLFPMPGRRGRPKTSDLSRQEQLAEAQRRYREKRRADGFQEKTFHLSEEDRAIIEQFRQSLGEKATFDEALSLAIKKSVYLSTEMTGLAPGLADDLEAMFPGKDLPDAMAEAAAKWVAEVRRKRDAARRSRGKK